MTRRERARRAAAERDAATQAAIVALVQDAEPQLDAAAISAAVVSVATGRGARSRLLAQLRDDQSLLTSGGSHATLAICGLAAALRAAGATTIVLPRCARCGEGVELVKRDDQGGGLCVACYNRGRVADCAGCGRHRRIAGRQADGCPLCSSCRAKDTSRRERCTGCGKLRSVNRRDNDAGALCSTCAQRARPLEHCDRCQQPGLIVYRDEHGATCQRCYRPPRRRCGGCGRIRRVALAADGERPDLCPTCHWAPIAVCNRCGTRTQCVGVRAHDPRCLRCIAADRLDQLLGDTPSMVALRDAFLAVEQPRSIHTWLDRSPARHVARRLATGELALTHALSTSSNRRRRSRTSGPCSSRSTRYPSATPTSHVRSTRSPACSPPSTIPSTADCCARSRPGASFTASAAAQLGLPPASSWWTAPAPRSCRRTSSSATWRLGRFRSRPPASATSTAGSPAALAPALTSARS